MKTHPIQLAQRTGGVGSAPEVVTLRAYEVYCHVYGPQEALITGNCRGGFSVGELIVYLYASSFPKVEWKARVEQALTGLKTK